jgi:hypothetical protein
VVDGGGGYGYGAGGRVGGGYWRVTASGGHRYYTYIYNLLQRIETSAMLDSFLADVSIHTNRSISQVSVNKCSDAGGAKEGPKT